MDNGTANGHRPRGERGGVSKRNDVETERILISSIPEDFNDDHIWALGMVEGKKPVDAYIQLNQRTGERKLNTKGKYYGFLVYDSPTAAAEVMPRLRSNENASGRRGDERMSFLPSKSSNQPGTTNFVPGAIRSGAAVNQAIRRDAGTSSGAGASAQAPEDGESWQAQLLAIAAEDDEAGLGQEDWVQKEQERRLVEYQLALRLEEQLALAPAPSDFPAPPPAPRRRFTPASEPAPAPAPARAPARASAPGVEPTSEAIAAAAKWPQQRDGSEEFKRHVQNMQDLLAYTMRNEDAAARAAATEARAEEAEARAEEAEARAARAEAERAQALSALRNKSEQLREAQLSVEGLRDQVLEEMKATRLAEAELAESKGKLAMITSALGA